jgi:hypothetical protein
VKKKPLLSAFLTVILIGGLALAGAMRFGTVQASSDISGIPKLSVPEFTLKFVDHSYDIPPTYGIDQYTGETIVTKAGEHIDNRTIEIAIKNQPFTPFTDSLSGREVDLFYNIRYKGMFTENWTEMYGGKGKMVMYYQDDTIAQKGYPTQAYGSQYTTILFPLSNIPNNVQIQFQVQALEGYTNRTVTDSRILFSIVDYDFIGQESDWSSTQTITIGESQTPTPSPETTPTPPNMGPTSSPSHEPLLTPEQLKIIVGVSIAVAVTGAGVGLLIYLIKRK